MSTAPVDWVASAAALGCAAVGGVFFTFSTFTMQGLTRLPAAQGIAAMQSINMKAVRPAFMTLLFGSGAVCTALAVHGVARWPAEGAPPLVAGAVLYLVGAVGVTVARNVPLNDALMAAEPHSGGVIWDDYVRRWTRWNHVRTLSSLGAAAIFISAVVGRA